MIQYTYEDFLKIIQVLRSENGCPWDREQTHMSLRSCLLEETAEVLDGIRIYDRTGDYENLREELGDVLLQVVMHAQIASEEGIFTMEDVVNEVAGKMVRRHPHVFGEKQLRDSGEVLESWEEIKKQEKKTDRKYEPSRDYHKAVEALETAARNLKEMDPCDSGKRISGQLEEILMAACDIKRLCK